MSPKRKKDAAPAAPPPGEVSGDDRLVLTGATRRGRSGRGSATPSADTA